MDVTPLFKACIKVAKVRNKAIGVQNPTRDEKRILKSKPKNAFVTTAKNITAQITKLRDFLMEHREGYLSFFNNFTAQSMTDEERDQIEAAAQRSISSCTHLIKEFRNDIRKQTVSPQMREFMNAVIELIETYLKSVHRIYSEIKSLRIKKALDIQKLSRLEMCKPTVMEQTKPAPEATLEKEEVTDSWLQRQDSENEVAVIDDELSWEELQMFESENVQLLNDLNSMNEEVQLIESKVMHIAELQEIFSEKVLQQEQDIDRIANNVVGATENVKDANDQIKQAIQRNAGLRVYILFFLLVMSFTLLFLDWYND